MMEKLTQAKIDELRTTVKYAELEDLRLEITKGADTTLAEDVRAYLRHFAQHPRDVDGKFISGHPCIGCGENLGGSLTDQLLTLGGFEWGLVHGQGHCRNCGWPATLYPFHQGP
jgi:hypothetical protein